MKESIRETVKGLPASPGVYMMKDREGKILYVGKAKNLRNRVRSYFVPKAHHTAKTEVMLSRVFQVDFMVTASEVEAFILESNLIKKNRPRYNILLKDDKHYPYLRLTVQEEFPRLEVVRKVGKDGALYFGPYVPGSRLRSTLDLIERTFPLRKSKRKIEGTGNRPCLNYQIGRCLAPCAGKISKTEYGRIVQEVTLFLKGRNRILLRKLRSGMETAARDLKFEKAARLRDQIRRIERVTERQKIISTALEDKDVLGVAHAGNTACVEILFVRGGRLLGKKEFFFELPEDDPSGVLLHSFLSLYYGEESLIPPRIFVPGKVPDGETLEWALTALRGRRTRIVTPHRGLNHQLIRMANENAELALQGYLREKDRDRILLKDLQKRADLQRFPQRIEAFDISNIQGEFPVASMVVFENGRPRNSHYRHFRVRSVAGANDYAMMEEVLMRRYRPEPEAPLPMPDLIMVDGGKGQLHVLCRVSEEIGFASRTDLMALAKARPGRGDDSVDRILRPGWKTEIRLKPDDPVIHLLQRVRDESHRFAINYYRKLHTKDLLSTQLLEIPGVGRKRSLSLLKHFGSLRQVREASLEELLSAPAINREVALRIYHSFHSRGNAAP
ncbi:MAG: excinuclease ABC subunit UvrC [Deltaproteobacteria bacterium]|nr:excinuclease ABC subunit UvrC [Deltaproteobacteria bacterium]